MREKQILVIRKEPGKSAEVEPLFENTLEAFQAAANGQATKIIIPSEIQGLVGLANGLVEGSK